MTIEMKDNALDNGFTQEHMEGMNFCEIQKTDNPAVAVVRLARMCMLLQGQIDDLKAQILETKLAR